MLITFGEHVRSWENMSHWQGPQCLRLRAVKAFPGPASGNWQRLPLFHVWMLTRHTESINCSSSYKARLSPPSCTVHNKYTNIPCCTIIGAVPSEWARSTRCLLFCVCLCLPLLHSPLTLVRFPRLNHCWVLW